MADKADVTFSMMAEDLEFLVFAMKFLEGGIEEETLRGYWQSVFERTLDEEFPVAEENTPNPPQSTSSSKRIVIEFVGGFKDGQRYSTASDDSQECELAAGLYYGFSEMGKIGKRFRSVSEAGIAELQEIVENTPDGPRLKREPTAKMDHIYEVKERIETDNQITVRYQYMGREINK